MNRLFVCIALLLGSVTEPLLAQQTEADAIEAVKKEADDYQKGYGNWSEPVALEVKLAKGNLLVLNSKTYEQSKLVQRPDSLVRLFWREYGSILEKLPESTESVSARYLLDENHEPLVLWQKYPSAVAQYALLDKELVSVKSGQDTLRIKVEKQDRQTANLLLIVNDLRDIPSLFDEIGQKTNSFIDALENKIPRPKLTRLPGVHARYLGDQKLVVHTPGLDMLIINPGVSLGYIRGNWMTSLDLGLTFYLPKSPIKPTFGYQHQYFFGKDLEGKTNVFQNGFAVAGLSFFKKTDRTKIDSSPPTQTGQLTVGYLVHRRGDYYEPNTWRITGGLNLTPNIKVEPEVYFNGAFKNLSPGLRFTIGF